MGRGWSLLVGVGRRAIGRAVAVVVALLASDVWACGLHQRTPAELRDAADVVIRGTVVSRDDPAPSFRGVGHTYRIEVLALERGEAQADSVRVQFEDLRPHRRGDTTVCPLRNGSGIEHDLRTGTRYRLHLRSGPILDLLLAEPLP